MYTQLDMLLADCSLVRYFQCLHHIHLLGGTSSDVWHLSVRRDDGARTFTRICRNTNTKNRLALMIVYTNMCESIVCGNRSATMHRLTSKTIINQRDCRVGQVQITFHCKAWLCREAATTKKTDHNKEKICIEREDNGNVRCRRRRNNEVWASRKSSPFLKKEKKGRSEIHLFEENGCGEAP